jgi:hypothetical protein
MIEDVPTAQDFYDSGRDLLSTAWDMTISLVIDLEEMVHHDFLDIEWVDEEKPMEIYWKTSKRRLITALSLVQQGVEFILKGRIAEVSPFLLLSDPPSRLPSASRKAVKFSQLRTIDAQDLPKLCGLYCQTPLTTEFIGRFNKLREKRNTLMHTVEKNVRVEVSEVLESVLFMHTEMFPSVSWSKTLVESFLANKLPGIKDDGLHSRCYEISTAFKFLTPKQVLRYFGVDKKQRGYYCPRCHPELADNFNYDFKLAFLIDKRPETTSLRCIVCENTYFVDRKDCAEDECRGDVIGTDEDNEEICLTCGNVQPSPDGDE